MKKQYIILLLVAGLLSFFTACKNEATYRTLIITGQNNHKWKESSPILKTILDETGLFSCEIAISLRALVSLVVKAHLLRAERTLRAI